MIKKAWPTKFMGTGFHLFFFQENGLEYLNNNHGTMLQDIAVFAFWTTASKEAGLLTAISARTFLSR